MKTSLTAAAAVMCWLGGGFGGFALAGDLDSALEKINISTESQNVPKKTDKASVPCAKSPGINCPSVQEDVNKNAYEASAIQGAITGGVIPSVTINGVSAGETLNRSPASSSLGGF